MREEETDELTVIGTAWDITERKQAGRAIHQLAYYDSLTGLANRVLFKDRLSNALPTPNATISIWPPVYRLGSVQVINDKHWGTRWRPLG
ncbi:MAG: GGDEF domain-containing protein [Nitrospira sp.]|nr:GGDEF domain-containing protein [Nitrospira sp.]